MVRILNIDKPKGWSSFDVIRFLKRLLNEKKAGHLGTLDPLASGVLPVFLGKGTRLIPFFNETDKVYRAHIHLGIRTDTFDSEGRILEEKECPEFPVKDLETALSFFQGRHLQRVPIYSAVKFEGKRAYQLAREGREIEMPKREVEFMELELESVKLPFLQIRVHCSKGTYIRSLAEELGAKLEVGAHLNGLERLQCGKHFCLEDAYRPETLEELEPESLPWLDPIDLLEDWITLDVDSPKIQEILQGRRIPLDQNLSQSLTRLKENGSSKTSLKAKAVSSENKLIAVGHFVWENVNCHFQPSRVLVQE